MGLGQSFDRPRLLAAIACPTAVSCVSCESSSGPSVATFSVWTAGSIELALALAPPFAFLLYLATVEVLHGLTLRCSAAEGGHWLVVSVYALDSTG